MTVPFIIYVAILLCFAGVAGSLAFEGVRDGEVRWLGRHSRKTQPIRYWLMVVWLLALSIGAIATLMGMLSGSNIWD